MNKQELASKIWAGANELRGKVSASSYKDYMLGLIFYKYLWHSKISRGRGDPPKFLGVKF